MPLIVKRAGAAEYGKWVKMLLAGDPGAGKTRLSSTAPNVLYANIEAGLMSVTDRHPAFVDITKTEDLNQLRQQLSQVPEVRQKQMGVDVDTVCIDTIDNLQRLFVAERLEEQHKEVMAIADWGWLGDQMRGVIRAFRNLDMHVIFTCHIKTVEDSETGRAYVKPALQGAMQDEIAAYVDLAVLLKANPTTKIVDGESKRLLVRSMQTFPDINHPWLKDRSGKLPMDFGVNLNNDFERIINLIFTDAPQEPTDTTGTVEDVPPPPPPAKATSAAKKAPAKKAAATAPEDSSKEVSQSAGQVVDAPEPVVTAPPVADEPPADPTPDPEPTPDGDAGASSSSAAPTSQQELKAPQVAELLTEAPKTTQETDDRIPCENPDCTSGGFVENSDQADLSGIRFHKALCRACFRDAKSK